MRIRPALPKPVPVQKRKCGFDVKRVGDAQADAQFLSCFDSTFQEPPCYQLDQASHIHEVIELTKDCAISAYPFVNGAKKGLAY